MQVRGQRGQESAGRHERKAAVELEWQRGQTPASRSMAARPRADEKCSWEVDEREYKPEDCISTWKRVDSP